MIRAVRANQKGFHTAAFTPGVNLILADRCSAAGDKDTTNAFPNPRQNASAFYREIARHSNGLFRGVELRRIVCKLPIVCPAECDNDDKAI
jgi:hypothetical protein